MVQFVLILIFLRSAQGVLIITDKTVALAHCGVAFFDPRALSLRKSPLTALGLFVS